MKKSDQITPTANRLALDKISRHLLAFHRQLLHAQKRIYEVEHNTQLTAHEFFGLTTGHADFEWLRKISEIIVEIDEHVDNESDTQVDLFSVDAFSKLRILLMSEQASDFKGHLDALTRQDAEIDVQLVSLKKALSQNFN